MPHVFRTLPLLPLLLSEFYSSSQTQLCLLSRAEASGTAPLLGVLGMQRWRSSEFSRFKMSRHRKARFRGAGRCVRICIPSGPRRISLPRLRRRSWLSCPLPSLASKQKKNEERAVMHSSNGRHATHRRQGRKCHFEGKENKRLNRPRKAIAEGGEKKKGKSPERVPSLANYWVPGRRYPRKDKPAGNCLHCGCLPLTVVATIIRHCQGVRE